ncbi:MAG: hypothetical protein FWE01_00535 [Firmicutes bacterium]|nr:hypothetical protein [Bacillota bacterium]
MKDRTTNKEVDESKKKKEQKHHTVRSSRDPSTKNLTIIPRLEQKQNVFVKIFITIWQKKFLLIILAMLVALLPMAVSKQSMALTRTILTAIAIDMEDDEIIVYGEHVLFNFDPFGIPERHIAVGRGTDITEALADIGVNMGRTVSFSHCTLIVIGSGLDDANLFDVLMPLYKQSQLNTAAALVYTEGDVEALIQTSIDTGDVRSAKLQQIAEFNLTHKDKYHTSLERFFKQTLRRNSVARMPIINDNDGELDNTGKTAKFIGGSFSEIEDTGI